MDSPSLPGWSASETSETSETRVELSGAAMWVTLPCWPRRHCAQTSSVHAPRLVLAHACGWDGMEYAGMKRPVLLFD
jgi:hypothetical protein